MPVPSPAPLSVLLQALRAAVPSLRGRHVAAARPWLVFAIASCAQFVLGLDHALLTVVLPTMTTDLQATASEAAWIYDAYPFAVATLVLTFGTLIDRLGWRRVLSLGLLLFGAATVGACLASDPWTLALARLATGVGAAAIMPAIFSALVAGFSSRQRRRIGPWWATISGLGLPVGTLAGGALLEPFGQRWQLVFLVTTVPVAAVALAAMLCFVPPAPVAGRDVPVDWIGMALSGVGLGTLVLAGIEAPHRGWSAWQLMAVFGAGASLLAAFVAWELRWAAHPMADLRIFRERGFAIGVALVGLEHLIAAGVLYLLVPYLRFVQRHDPKETAWRLLPVAVLVLAGPLVGRLIRGLPPDAVAPIGAVGAAGIALMGGAMLTLSFGTADSGYGLVLGCLLAAGVGMGTAAAAGNALLLSSLPAARQGVGAAIGNASTQIHQALSLAWVTFVSGMVYRRVVDGQAHALPADAVARARDGIAATFSDPLDGVSPVAQQLAQLGYVAGFRTSLVVAAAIAGCAVATLAAALWRRR